MPNSAEAVARELINTLAQIPNPFGQAAIEFTVQALTRSAAAEQVQVRQERDEQMERLKGCDEIAEGNEGWQKIPLDCPSLLSVAKLRKECDTLRAALREYGKHTPICHIITWQPHEDDAPTPIIGKCTCGFTAALGGTDEETRFPS